MIRRPPILLPRLALALMLGGSGMAHADLVSAPTNAGSPMATASLTPTSGASGMLGAASTSAAAAAPTVTLTSTAAALPTMLGVLTVNVPTGNGNSTRNYLLTLNNNFELTLWNFIVTLNAQQNGQPIDAALGNLNNITNTLTPNTSVGEIPLPAAGWLFLTGLAGLAAARVRRRTAAGAFAGAVAGGAAPSREQPPAAA